MLGFGFHNRYKRIDVETYNLCDAVQQKIYPSACRDQIWNGIMKSEIVCKKGTKTLKMKPSFKKFYDIQYTPLKKDILDELLKCGFVIITFDEIPVYKKGKLSKEIVPLVVKGRLGIDYDVIVYSDPKVIGSTTLQFYRLIDKEGNIIPPTPDPNVLVFTGIEGIPNANGKLTSPASKIIKDVMDITQLNYYRLSAEFIRSNPIIFTETTEQSEGALKEGDFSLTYGDATDVARSTYAKTMKNTVEIEQVYSRNATIMRNQNENLKQLQSNYGVNEQLLYENQSRFHYNNLYPLPMNHKLVKQQLPDSFAHWDIAMRTFETNISNAYGVPRSIMVNDSTRTGGESAIDTVTKTFEQTISRYKKAIALILSQLYDIIYGDMDDAQLILYEYLNKNMGFNVSENAMIPGTYLFSMNNIMSMIQQTIAAKQMMTKNGGGGDGDDKHKKKKDDNDDDHPMIMSKEDSINLFKMGAKFLIESVYSKTNVNNRLMTRQYGDSNSPNEEDDDPYRTKEKRKFPGPAFYDTLNTKTTSNNNNQQYNKELNILDDAIILDRFRNNNDSNSDSDSDSNDDDDDSDSDDNNEDNMNILMDIALINNPDEFNNRLTEEKKEQHKNNKKNKRTTEYNFDKLDQFKFSKDLISNSSGKDREKITIEFTNTPIATPENYLTLWSLGILPWNDFAEYMVKSAGINPADINIPTKDLWDVQSKLDFFSKNNASALTKLGVTQDILFPKLTSPSFQAATTDKPKPGEGPKSSGGGGGKSKSSSSSSSKTSSSAKKPKEKKKKSSESSTTTTSSTSNESSKEPKKKKQKK